MKLDERLPLMQFPCKNNPLGFKEFDNWKKIFLCLLIRVIIEHKVLFILICIYKTEELKYWPTIRVDPVSTFLADFYIFMRIHIHRRHLHHLQLHRKLLIRYNKILVYSQTKAGLLPLD